MQDWLTLRWTTLLVRGLVGVAFGVVAMAWPDETVSVVVVLWGCWALLDGVMTLAVAGQGAGHGGEGGRESSPGSWLCSSPSSRS